MSAKGDIVKQKHCKYNMQSWGKQKGLNPLPIERAEGIYLYDYDGNRYTDMSSQLVNMNLGHGNKEIGDAIKAQVDRFCFVAPSYAAESRSNLAEKLVGLLPESFGKIFFTNAGAEANENALKIARMYTGRHKFFSRYRSYHGATYAAANLTGEPRRYPSEPGITGFVKFFDPYLYRTPVPFDNDIAAGEFYLRQLEEQINYEGSQNVAAIFLETVTGSNGVLIPPSNYLPGVRALCDKYGILMICDEVMTGFGRTGKMFAFENWDVVPDIVTFAKGVTCGYVPLGGVAMTQKIADFFEDNPFMCGLTYSGHPLACAAGNACVDYLIEREVLDNVSKVGKVLGELLENLKVKYDCIGDVRYIGLFSAIEFVKSSKTKEALVPYGRDAEGTMGKILAQLKQRGFCTYSHENMVIVAPPLITTEAQLREEMAKMDEVCDFVQKNLV